MSTLGTMGRLGNQVFQFAFLKLYASHYSLGVQTSPWLGQYLFGHQDPPIQTPLPVVSNISWSPHPFKPAKPAYINVDIEGQFSWHTSFYKPYKSQFQALFQPKPAIRARLEQGMNELRSKGKTIVGIHIRRGDFLRAKYADHPRNFPVPTEWYTQWLHSIWKSLDQPVLYIASDDLKNVTADFQLFNPVTYVDLFSDFPKEPMFHDINPSIYPDYYVLTQCDLLAISNSSYSFSASMLNTRCHTFMRPHKSKALVSYFPWNSNVRIDIR
jgi:hypothetical protein